MNMTLTRPPKVVISIVGDSDTGKSRLLREFAQKLKWDDTKKVISGRNCGNWRTKTEGDIRVSGCYQGVRIAIMSGGDDADTIIRAFIYAEIWKCDILIVATHPKQSKSGLTISWTSLEAMTVAYGTEWLRINKMNATDKDRNRTLGELRIIVNQCIISHKKED